MKFFLSLDFQIFYLLLFLPVVSLWGSNMVVKAELKCCIHPCVKLLGVCLTTSVAKYLSDRWRHRRVVCFPVSLCIVSS